MKKNKISVLFAIEKDITLHYSLYPIFKSKFLSDFDFFNEIEEVFLKDKNDSIIIFGRMFTSLSQNSKEELTLRLANKYKRLIFFDDLDGSEIHFFEFFKYFDLYFKKQKYSDLSNYLKKLDGNKLFTDFYSKNNSEILIKPSNYNGQFLGDKKELNKIKVAWNLGIGSYYPLNSKLMKLIYRSFGPKGMNLINQNFPKNKNLKRNETSKCQARFSFNPKRYHIDFQRKLFLEIIAGNKNFLSGKIPPEKYVKEIKDIKAVLSPFGFGEICFRDFEAIFNGAVLVKPDMSHLDTWPNIFDPNITYLPINWDGSDLLERVDNLLSNVKMIEELRQNAFQVLKESHNSLEDKVSEFFDLIHSLK